VRPDDDSEYLFLGTASLSASVTALQRFLRILLLPVRRLLDGRVADVNRRIADVRGAVEQQGGAIEQLSRELAAYSVTQNEATSFTGVELRRLVASLERLGASLESHEVRLLDLVSEINAKVEQLDERGYVERLDRASKAPLSELDGALAGALNLAAGHRGFAAQGGLWFNPSVSIELGEKSARIADINERIVELPFALGQLSRLAPPARILDVGAAESTFALSAASLGYRVTALDPQGVPYEHPNLEVFSCRLEDWEGDAEPFGAVFLISAVEHFGLGAYGERLGDTRSDHAALLRIRELLAEDGLLVLTTPYGEASVDEFERVYDDAGLEQLLEGWKIIERRAVTRTERLTWRPGIGGDIGVVLVAATPLTAP
jgi:hypothetical protein